MKNNKQIEPVPDAVKRRIAKTLTPIREHVARVSPLVLAETRLEPRGYRVPFVDDSLPYGDQIDEDHNSLWQKSV